MADDDEVHQHLRERLNAGDVDYVIEALQNDDVDVDHRYVTHDLQTLTMNLCYVNLETSSVFAILNAILDRSPDVNIQDSWGRTALVHACIANKPCIIEKLLEYEHMNIGVTDFDGNSALSYAVQNCDIYTLEDLLQHRDGSSLLSIHNAKGQTPCTIAEKCGNKEAMRLFENYMNKSTPRLRQKTQKRRKPRSRDVTKNLPPAYSPSPERKCNTSPSSPRKVGYLPSRNCNSVNKVVGDSPPTMSNSAIIDKCDSAPVRRVEMDTDMRPKVEPSLSLSSPRLMRRHHRQDCLLTETLLHNQSKKLPYFKSDDQSETDQLELPAYSLRRQRRPSVSLPDLRNVIGCLVSSGTSSPTTDGGSDSRACSPSPDVENDSETDDVFSNSYPRAVLTDRRSEKFPYGRQLSEQKLLLPEINKGTTTLMTTKSNRKGVSSLVKQRKYSTSDDQINRTVVT